MKKINNVDGFLFIGDPHLWSRGPGRRLDRDTFSTTSLNKLEQAIDIANQHNLLPIILGDLFHVNNENSINLITRTARILKKAKHRAVTVLGNHEIDQKSLSDNVAITLLKETELIDIIDTYDTLWAQATTNDGQTVYIGGTSYSFRQLPKKISQPQKAADHVLWLTHHDLDFGYSYPGVITIPEIEGVDLLVNGHIHKTLPPTKVGNMQAFNPGNILRLSIDTHDHVPSVWLWKPEKDKPYDFTQIPLIYEKDIFDLTGRQIEATEKPIKVKPLNEDELSSVFVEKMQIEARNREQVQTDDGAYIKENIKSLGKALDIDKSFLSEIIDLADEVINSSSL